MKMRLSLLSTLLAIALVTASCEALPQAPSTPGPDLAATNLALNATLFAYASQSTAESIAKIAAASAEPTLEITQTPLVITATPEPTSPPTETPLPSDTPTPDITPTPNAGELTRQLEARLQAANILIYEEPDNQGRLTPRLDKALAGMNFSGGTVINTHNYLGNFDRLLRSQTWDLVILSVENRDREVIGSLGVLDPLSDHINRGGALIVETWNLDEDNSALAGLLLDVCGASVEKEWRRPETFNYAEFLISALQSNSPIFTTPNEITMPLRPNVFWKGDAGDLLRLDGSGNSKILAGLVSEDPNNYGLLTSCLEGRLILQTFSTHDYSLYDTTRLWQNMIHSTLLNYFSPVK